MKKLKVDELTTSESLSQEEKEALLGGAKGTFSPDLAKPEAGSKVRKLRDHGRKIREKDDIQGINPDAQPNGI